MKFLQRKALTVLALLTITGSAFGYRWGFTNGTNKTLVIKLTLNGTDAEFFNIVGPGMRTEFDWGWGNARAGFCLSSIILGEYKKTASDPFPMHLGSAQLNALGLPVDTRDPKVLSASAIEKAIDARGPWFYSLRRQPMREPKVTFIKNEAWGDFDAEVNKAISNLVKGVGMTAEKIAELVAKSQGVPLSLQGVTDPLSAIVTSIVDLAKMGKCVSRHFDILETKDGSIQLFTKQ
jgi:hypothetical protein